MTSVVRGARLSALRREAQWGSHTAPRRGWGTTTSMRRAPRAPRKPHAPCAPRAPRAIFRSDRRETQIWLSSPSHEVKRRSSLFILPQKNYCTILFYFLGFLPSFFLFLLYFFLLLFFLFSFYLLFSVIICMMIEWFAHLIFFYIFCKTFVICYFNELRLISSIKRILYFLFYVNNVRLASINRAPRLAPRAWGSTGFCASMRLSPLITLV